MALRTPLNWLRANTSSLALALLLGLTVWIIANQEENPVQEANLTTPVRVGINGLGEGLIVTSDLPETTRVRLRAQRNTWLSLTTDDVLATLDLTGLGTGTHQVRIDFQIAAQAVLVSANPQTVIVEIEEESQRQIPIHVGYDGILPTGYSTGDALISPVAATVRGPRSAVESISDVQAVLALDGMRETFSGDLTLVALDAEGRIVENVTLDPPIVRVEVPITQEAGYRDIAIVARTIGQPAVGYYIVSIRVVPDLITVRGDPDLIAAMLPYAETRPINLSGLDEDLISEVTLDLPPGVTPVEQGPIQMLVTIEALRGSRSLTVTIQPVGLGQGLSVRFSPTAVTLILSGPLPVLERLNEEDDILVTLDLTGLGPGTYQLEPRVEIFNSEVALESIFPAVISATLTRN